MPENMPTADDVIRLMDAIAASPLAWFILGAVGVLVVAKAIAMVRAAGKKGD